jgi:hypothetical protein
MNNGSVTTFGKNSVGQLGNGKSGEGTDEFSPKTIYNGDDAQACSAGKTNTTHISVL